MMALSKQQIVLKIIESLGMVREEIVAFLSSLVTWEKDEREIETAYEWKQRTHDSMQAQFNVFPPEDKRYRFVVQFHYRGKSRHADLRMKVNDHLVGWTLNEQVAGKLKEPIETLANAKKETAAWRTNSKINNAPGSGGKKILVEAKPPIPLEWLDFEGTIPKGKIGATKESKGVFDIFDKGIVEYGTQKARFHEYFLHGKKMDGRWLVRQLPAAGLRSTDAKKKVSSDFIWFFWKAKDDTPYILSKSGVDDRWVPPLGISALPKELRRKIPERFHYWNKRSRNERLKLRDALVEALKKKEVKLTDVELSAFNNRIDLLSAVAGKLYREKLRVRTAPFVLQRHWWLSQGISQQGASRQYFDLRFNFPNEKGTQHYILADDPIENEETSAIRKSTSSKEWMSPEKRLCMDTSTGGLVIPSRLELAQMTLRDRPKIKGIEEENPTKNMPAFLVTLAKGKASFLIDTVDVKRVRFESKALSGTFTLTREDKGSMLYGFQRTKLSVEKKDDRQRVLFEVKEALETRFISGVCLKEGVIKGIHYSGEEIAKAMPTLLGKQIRVYHANEGYDNVGWVTNVSYDENEKEGRFEGFVVEKFAIQRMDDDRLNFLSPGLSFTLETVEVEKPDGTKIATERKVAYDIRFDEISLLENPASLFHRVLLKEVRMLESFRLLEAAPHPFPEGKDVLKIAADTLSFVLLARRGQPFPPKAAFPLPAKMTGPEPTFIFDGKEVALLQDFPMPRGPQGQGVFKIDASKLDSIVVVRQGVQAAPTTTQQAVTRTSKKPLVIDGPEINYVLLIPKNGITAPGTDQQVQYALPSKNAVKISGSQLGYIMLAPKGFKADTIASLSYLPEKLAEGEEGQSTHEELAETFTEKPWVGGLGRFTLEQAISAVPAAIRAWAKKQTGQEKREVIKSDLKLPIREPDGTVNVNALRNALARASQVKGLPADVLSSAVEEIRSLLNQWKSRQRKEESQTAETVDLHESGEAGVHEFRLSNEHAIIVPLVESVAESFDEEKLEIAVTIVRPGRSGNDNDYALEGLNKSYAIFEGLKCYDNHIKHRPFGGRSTKEQVGFYKDVTVDENGVHAILKVFPSEKWAFERMKEQVLNPNAKICGISIDATGRGRIYMNDGRKIRLVEEIVKAASADLVGEAAAGGSIDRLVEGKLEDEMLTTKEIKEKHPDLVNEIKEEIAAANSTALAQANEKIQKLEDQNAKLQKDVEDAKLQEDVDKKLKSKEVVKMSLKSETVERLSEKLHALGKEEMDGSKSTWDKAIESEVAYLKATSDKSEDDGEERGSDVVDADNIDLKESKKTSSKTTKKRKRAQFSEDKLIKGVMSQFQG